MNSKRAASYATALFVGVLALATGCGTKDIVLPSIDTPSHHVQTGNRMLEMNKIGSAHREFSRALELDPKYAPAFIGVALVHSMRNEYDRGLAAIEDARRFARGKEQEMSVHIAAMRFFLIGRDHADPNWLSMIKDAFKQAVLTDENDPAAHYYMGLAYKEAKQYDLAARHFYRVMEMGRAFGSEASEQYRAAEEMAKPTR